MRQTPLLLLTALLIPLCAGESRAGTKVDRNPATVAYHYFDPQNKPADMPQLNPGEAALCRGDYGIAVQLSYEPRTRRQADGGGYTASLRVDSVEVKLTLQNDIWLPKGFSERLKKHEEGHRQISEMLYDRVAEKAARKAADKLVGRRFEGEGKTASEASEAADKALSAAHSAMVQEYLDQTSRAGQKVQELYDEITAHGTRLKIAEQDAIKQAFEQKPPPLWPAAATQPADEPDKAPEAQTTKPGSGENRTR